MMVGSSSKVWEEEREEIREVQDTIDRVSGKAEPATLTARSFAQPHPRWALISIKAPSCLLHSCRSMHFLP